LVAVGGLVMESLEKLLGDGRYSSLLVKSSQDRMQTELFSAVRDVSGFCSELVYVSTNKPYMAVKEGLESDFGVDTGGVYFIDCISSSPSEGDGLDGVSFVLDTSDLNSLLIEVRKQLDRIKNGGFLFLDAVHTLWIYNKSGVVARFIQGVVERAYRSRVNVVFFIVDMEDRDLLRKTAPLFDHFTRVE